MPSRKSNSQAWPDFRLVIREANDIERDRIEASGGESLGTDVCMLVSLDNKIIGWGDDYGTFRSLAPVTGMVLVQLNDAGEQLLSAASAFYAATLR